MDNRNGSHPSNMVKLLPALAIPLLTQTGTKLLSCMIFSNSAQQPRCKQGDNMIRTCMTLAKSDLKSGPWSLNWRDMKTGKNRWVGTAQGSQQTSSLGEIKGEVGYNSEG